ncbi:MAG: hypothetical protein QF391_07830 [Myxococcota bacterium]|nr:hypothetical protein [Myxococcota bacterium]
MERPELERQVWAATLGKLSEIEQLLGGLWLGATGRLGALPRPTCGSWISLRALLLARREIGSLVSFVGTGIGVMGSMGYTLPELERVVDLTATGKLDLSGSIIARYPLGRVMDTLDDLASHRNDPVRLALLSASST